MSNSTFNFSGGLMLKFPLNGSGGTLENCFVFQLVIQNVNFMLFRHDE